MDTATNFISINKTIQTFKLPEGFRDVNMIRVDNELQEGGSLIFLYQPRIIYANPTNPELFINIEMANALLLNLCIRNNQHEPDLHRLCHDQILWALSQFSLMGFVKGSSLPEVNGFINNVTSRQVSMLRKGEHSIKNIWYKTPRLRFYSYLFMSLVPVCYKVKITNPGVDETYHCECDCYGTHQKFDVDKAYQIHNGTKDFERYIICPQFIPTVGESPSGPTLEELPTCYKENYFVDDFHRELLFYYAIHLYTGSLKFTPIAGSKNSPYGPQNTSLSFSAKQDTKLGVNVSIY